MSTQVTPPGSSAGAAARGSPLAGGSPPAGWRPAGPLPVAGSSPTASLLMVRLSPAGGGLASELPPPPGGGPGGGSREVPGDCGLRAGRAHRALPDAGQAAARAPGDGPADRMVVVADQPLDPGGHRQVVGGQPAPGRRDE